MFARHLGLGITSWVAVAVVCSAGPAIGAEPRPSKVSGAQIVISNRLIEVSGGVTFESMKKVQKELLELAAQGDDPIWMRINSPGGSVDAGLIVVDTMKSVAAPIHCIVESSAYSMAAILLTFCDKKYGMEHATFMLHEASYGTQGEDPQNRSKLDFLTKYLDGLHVEIAKNLKMDLKKYRARIRDAWWMLADEAKSIGLIDAIITNQAYEEAVLERREERKTISYTRDREGREGREGWTVIPKRKD